MLCQNKIILTTLLALFCFQMTWAQQPNVIIEGQVNLDTLLQEGFEDGSLSPLTDGGDVGWGVQSSIVFDGSFAARSGSLVPGQNSYLQYIVSSTESYKVNFWYLINTISIFDNFTFSKNDEIIFQNSAIQTWEERTFDFPAGTDTLVWRIEKGPFLFNSYVVLDQIEIRSKSALAFQLKDGTENFGRILISDHEGKAHWQEVDELFSSNELPIEAIGSDTDGFLAQLNNNAGIRTLQNEEGVVSKFNTQHGMLSDSNAIHGIRAKGNTVDGFHSTANLHYGFWSENNNVGGFGSQANGNIGYYATNHGLNGFYALNETTGFHSEGSGIGFKATENSNEGFYARKNDLTGFRADSNTTEGFLAHGNQSHGFAAEFNDVNGFQSTNNTGYGFEARLNGVGGFVSEYNTENGFLSQNNSQSGYSAVSNTLSGYYAGANDKHGFSSFLNNEMGFLSALNTADGYYAHSNTGNGYTAFDNTEDGFVAREHYQRNGFRSVDNETGVRADSNDMDGFYSEENGRYGFHARNNADDGFISSFNGEDGFFSASNVANGFRSVSNGLNGYISSNNTLSGYFSTNNNNFGFYANQEEVGFYSTASANDGFYAQSNTDDGFYALSNGDDGFYSLGNVGDEGYFSGTVTVTGALSKGSGSFKIDHPLDPENQYLYHSFVESPDMMNVYNGNIILDELGVAEVSMPDWFEHLNMEFRYQLTCIGGFAQVFIAEELNESSFKIAGGSPGLKVSWQITGIRKDPYAMQNRIEVEVEKEKQFRGYYLHPEAYDQPFTKSHDYVKLGHQNLEHFMIPKGPEMILDARQIER